MTTLIEVARALGTEFSCDPRWAAEAAKTLRDCVAAMEASAAYKKRFDEIIKPVWEQNLEQSNRQCRHLMEMVDERDKEIERLKNRKDQAALNRAWFDGYVMATAHFSLIISNLEGALHQAPTEEHHHHGHEH